MDSDTTLLTIATVSGARGVRGEVKLRPVDTPPTWLNSVKQIRLTQAVSPQGKPRQQWMTVTRWQWKDPYVLAYLSDIPTREDAAAWAKAEVEAAETDLPPLPADAYRARDLEGKAVWQEGIQQPVATVEALMFHGDDPYLKLKQGDKTWLLPFQNVFIPRIEPDRLWINLNLDDLS
jgi:ribosomal 30S subunit maturation factor RimM